MKKRIQKIIKEALIFGVTLITGAAISGVSFNLFDALTSTQVRVLFAIDIAILVVIGAITLIIYESKQSKKEREEKFRERHNKRIEENERRMSGIEEIISFSKYAA